MPPFHPMPSPCNVPPQNHSAGANAAPTTIADRRSFLQAAALAAAAVGIVPANAPQARADEPAIGQDSPGMKKIRELLAGKEPVTWVITGDSITHGALHTLGWRSYPEHFAERVRWELRRVRDVVINTGISGDRTKGILADLDWRALRFQPGVVSLMFGMNDCNDGPSGRDAFKENYVALIDKISAAGAVPLLHTPNTIHVKNTGGRGDLPAYSDIVRELAKERNLPLVDHWAYWMKAKPDQEALLSWLEDKTIHPGVYGHRAFAQEMFRALGIFDPASPTCALETP